MKLIPLTQGKFAQVDDEDFEWLSKYTWHAQLSTKVWYARTPIKTGRNKYCITPMHRLIMGCTKGDGKIVDHKDHNGLNCQKNNLRFATKAENNVNRRSIGASKYLGVILLKPKRVLSSGVMKIYDRIVWGASIKLKGKRIYLGRFKKEEDAALAYNQAAFKYYGEFANLNIIPTQPPVVALEAELPKP